LCFAVVSQRPLDEWKFSHCELLTQKLLIILVFL
jgi:hypothetical protein